jgi:CPA2 family monovalent cation:H+ antiporter-2/glutathione-regulated potassium-efflux system protein KefB
MDGLLAQAFVYLLAAVVAVPVAKRLGLGSVLGYLIAGIVIGPDVLGFVGSEGQDVLHFAEFGVVLMLFVIGLELEPSLLWRLRKPILGMGGLQVLLSTAAITGGGIALGLPWNEALAVGMILALSSTAIVLQTLGEKGQLETSGGRSAFSVLLFQDIAVIPMLALLPLLGAGSRGAEAGDAGHAESASLLAGLPGWVQTLAVLGAVAVIVVGGRYAIRPVLRAIARTRSREIFTAMALTLVIGIALLMQLVGLSPALGTFLAGVVLATSEYRHELESDIDPFKGLLLGLFFLAVGASIDFGLIADQAALIFGIAVGVMAIKFIVLAVLARGFGLASDPALLFSFALPQMGEFAFVLFSFATQEGVLGADIVDPLVASVAISMALTPLLLLINDRVVRPRFGTKERDDRPMDEMSGSAPVLIAGFGVFGATVGRLLRAKKIETTVLEYDSDRVDLLRELGLEVYYGDATRHDLLEVAGARDARLLVVAMPDAETTMAVVRTARKHFPELRIFARAFDWTDARALKDEGAEAVYRQSLDTALRAGRDALTALGFRAYQAQRATRTFLRHDEESLDAIAQLEGDDRGLFISTARARIEDLERILRLDLDESATDRDRGWDPDSIREEYGGATPG